MSTTILLQTNQNISIEKSTMSSSEKWKKQTHHNDDDPSNYSDLSDHSETRKEGGNTKDKLPVVLNKIQGGSGGDSATTDPTGNTATTLTPAIIEETDDKHKNADDDLTGSEDLDDDFDAEVPSRVAPQRAISNISVLSLNTSFHTYGGDGNSVCGASTDGSYARSTRAESIRARMRQQEKRLTELVQKQASAESADVDKFKNEMNEVKSNLDKVEQEKYALEQKLEFLKTQQSPEQAAAISKHDVTDHDAFLRDKLNGIQRGFQEQASKIQALETEIVSKNAEIDKYRHEIVDKLRRIVELEFDLEMHDIHYTDYFDDYYKRANDEEKDEADRKPLEHAGAKENTIDITASQNAENDEKESAIDAEWVLTMNNGKKLTPRRAQKLIAKLLKDLDHLEATYKKEKLNTVRTKEQLKSENEELRTKILVLEQEQKQTELQQKSKNNLMGGMNESGSGYMNIYRLRKRVETLEAKRFLYRKEMTRIKDEMTTLENEVKIKERRHEIELSKLQLQLEAANARCQVLIENQNGLNPGSDVKKSDFEAIEQKILENYEKVAKIQASVEIKDRQIDSLKKEVQNLRLAKIAAGKGGDKYKKSDVDALNAEKETVVAGADGSSTTDDDDNKSTLALTNVSASFVADLQKQLLMAHEQLVKKDQELVIERAKSACMAANLLDRIAELDKEAEKAKRREQMLSRKSITGANTGDSPVDGASVHRSTRYNDDRSIRSRTISQNDDASVRSTRSFMTADGDSPDKKRKPRKSMVSRIPFRFGVSKDQAS